MSIFYGIDSNYASTLFSSLNTGSKSNSTSGLTDLLSEYSNIKSGSYKKLLTAYYSSDSNKTDGSTSNVNSISTAGDSSKKLTSIKNVADELSSTSEALTATGSKSVFKKVSVEAEDGSTAKEYDTDAIYKAVKAFVDDYNELVSEAEDSNTKTIASNMQSIISTTKSNSSMLEDLGITINKDYTLDIDKDTFKKSDMSVAKSMFNGTGSYAYQVGVKASLVSINATSEAAKSNTYTSTGNYSYNYNSGDLYNTWF